MRVLIADDKSEIRSLVVELLQREGYEPIEACDGLAALAQIKEASGPFKLVLSWLVEAG